MKNSSFFAKTELSYHLIRKLTFNSLKKKRFSDWRKN